MGDFVNSPMSDTFQKNGSIPEGSAGVYDGDGGCPIFGEYKRTKSGNGVREKFYEKSMPNPSGEPDQF
jgi:hypothetical protein